MRRKTAKQGIEEFENLCRGFGLMAVALTEARNTLAVIAEGQCADPQRAARDTFARVSNKLRGKQND